MKEQAYGQLTFFPADSPANHSASPGSAEAIGMTVISGLKCYESYQSCGLLGSLERMCLGSSIWHSTRCFLTWKQQATKAGHSVFRLAVSTPRTNESGSPFWPTPTTGSALCAGTGSFRMLKQMQEKGLITEEERRNLSQGNGGKTNPELLEWMMGYERAFTGLLPTPIASQCKGAKPSRFVGGAEYRWCLHELLEATPRGQRGRMNPNWIEWLMGYPIGWTELSA